jgi:hypothetical protein
MQFDSFVAIDWSGARSPKKGIQVAECGPGNRPPILIAPSRPMGTRWRRYDVLQWIKSKLTREQRMLIGLDFAFAYPYCDEEAYFPGNPSSPDCRTALWKLVEKTCARDKDLYGGSFYRETDAPFADYICYQTYTGDRFDNSRFRLTEEVCERLGTRPSCTFKCVGPDSVGIGSVAGMRLLNALCGGATEQLPVWPFASVSEGQSAVVEIFPRLYYVLADQDPVKWKDRSCLDRVLSYYDSEPVSGRALVGTEDEADAVVSAAALRHFAEKPQAWSPSCMSPCARQFEGWIFGVF